MCGLSAFYARESVCDYKYLDKLFTWGEKRGTDGFGLTHISRKENQVVTFKSIKPYSQCRDEVLKFFLNGAGIKIGDLILGISRAAPEQEPPTTENNMQPIVNNNCILVHNGSVSKKICNELSELDDYKYTTKIDSEAILHSYIHHQKNIKDAMEYISGGVAALMYDGDKDILYMITDFKPIAQGYIKGIGYFLASDNNCLGEIIQEYTGCTRDGVNTWEMYYHHYLSGGRIKSLDMQSGFVANIKYSPRFMTQIWDSNFNLDGTKKV